jgi:hypothetical protein
MCPQYPKSRKYPPFPKSLMFHLSQHPFPMNLRCQKSPLYRTNRLFRQCPMNQKFPRYPMNQKFH